MTFDHKSQASIVVIVDICVSAAPAETTAVVVEARIVIVAVTRVVVHLVIGLVVVV